MSFETINPPPRGCLINRLKTHMYEAIAGFIRYYTVPERDYNNECLSIMIIVSLWHGADY